MTKEMTKEEFIERYVARCLKVCGFTHFEDGYSVADHARASAEACFDAADVMTPEELADMEYWGEGIGK